MDPGRTRSSCAASAPAFPTQPGQRLDGLVPERRDLPGQSIRSTAESQPRHLCGRPRIASRFWKARRARCSVPARGRHVRYITNEPKLNVTEGNVDRRLRSHRPRRSEHQLTAVLNLPLIADTLAVRAVIYDDSRGGYIDNVPGTFTRKNTDIGIHYANYPAVNGQCPAAAQPLLRPPGSVHQQQQHRRQSHQSGHLPGNPRRGAVQVQRRLERC